MKNKLSSIVIVTHEHGSVASIRFEDRKDDKDISWTSKNTLYEIVEKYVGEITGV